MKGGRVADDIVAQFNDAGNIFGKFDFDGEVREAVMIFRKSGGTAEGAFDFAANQAFLTKAGQKNALTILDEAGHAFFRKMIPPSEQHRIIYGIAKDVAGPRARFIKYMQKYVPDTLQRRALYKEFIKRHQATR